MQGRSSYFNNVTGDAEEVTSDPYIIAALIIADGLNGVRRAILDTHPDSTRNRSYRDTASDTDSVGE
jgi:hypothetical protein